MTNEYIIKMPCSSDPLYDRIVSSINSTTWMMPILIVLTIALPDTSHRSNQKFATFFILTCLVCVIIFTCIRILTNVLFHQYIRITNGVMHLSHPRINGVHHDIVFDLTYANGLLWEQEKLLLYGHKNSLYLTYNNNEKNTIVKDHFSLMTNEKKWINFVYDLSKQISCPLQRANYFISGSQEKIQIIDQSIYKELSYRKRPLVLAIVIVAITILASSAASAFLHTFSYFIFIGLLSSLTCTASFTIGSLLFAKSSGTQTSTSLELIGLLTTIIPFFFIYAIFYFLFSAILKWAPGKIL